MDWILYYLNEDVLEDIRSTLDEEGVLVSEAVLVNVLTAAAPVFSGITLGIGMAAVGQLFEEEA